MIATHPALRRLGRLKFRGFWRAQLRRLRTVKGAIFGLLGLGAMLVWIGSLVLGQLLQPGQGVRAATEASTAAFMLAGVALTFFGSLSYRGLYIPEEEIDLLLSAPVSRGDIVRYRMLSSFVRTAFGALVISIFAAAKAPHPLFGFVGVWLFVVTLPVAGQALSLVAGGTESRLGRLVESLPRRTLGVVSVVLIALLMYALVSSNFRASGGGALGFWGEVERWMERPGLRELAWLVKPWTGMVRAEGFAEFAAWGAVAVLAWIGIFEFSARLAVDFRELSLATAADVAKKIARRRRGGVSATASVWSKAVGWKIPWLFGRGAFGAIAWRKTSSIVRKAGGTLLLSIAVIAFLTFTVDFGTEKNALEGLMGSSLFLVAIGALYLTMGLRFDFREDLERMDVIRSWPVRPWRVFAATLLPETLLVTAVLCLAILTRALLHGALHGLLLLMVPAVGCFVFVWVALDNALFLFVPVRYVPGQDGGLQHTGRAMLLLFARMVLLGFTALGAALPAAIPLLAGRGTSVDPAWLWAFALVGATGVLAVELALAIWVGGKLLATFDVARDRG